MMLVKSIKAKAAGVARRLGRRIARRGMAASIKFTDSRRYWEERYRAGRDSGAGSYGRLARFKADFLNRFVAEHSIQSVIEFGSGDGAQLGLAQYPRYVGVDVSPTAIERCRSTYRGRANFQFRHMSEYSSDLRADLSLSLDVIYHLVEDEIYVDYMNRLFDCASRYAIIYSSDFEERPAPHVRHRKFTIWVESNRPDFRLRSFEANPYPPAASDPDNTSPADFYVYERV